jgi:hypothetical protein
MFPSSDMGREDIDSTGSLRSDPVTEVIVPETLGSLESRKMDEVQTPVILMDLCYSLDSSSVEKGFQE